MQRQRKFQTKGNLPNQNKDILTFNCFKFTLVVFSYAQLKVCDYSGKNALQQKRSACHGLPVGAGVCGIGGSSDANVFGSGLYVSAASWVKTGGHCWVGLIERGADLSQLDVKTVS